MTRLARLVSIAAHPLVTALVLVGAVEWHRGRAAAAGSVAAVALLFGLPIGVLMGRQVRRGAWGTVDASDPRERPVLFAVGAAALLALLGYLALARPGSGLLRGGLVTLGMVAVCAAALRWVKLSLHLAAAALAATVLVGEGHALGWGIAAGLPLLAWARVAMGRHRWHEVALGTLVGAATGAVVTRLG